MGSVGITNNISNAFNNIMRGNSDISELSKLQGKMQIDNTQFNTSYDTLQLQSATIKDGNNSIVVSFYTNYDTRLVQVPKSGIETRIEVRTYADGDIKSLRTVDKSNKSKSLKNSKAQYEVMLEKWKKLTNQKTISIK